jgi:hypothetical protein
MDCTKKKRKNSELDFRLKLGRSLTRRQLKNIFPFFEKNNLAQENF